jgi:hypothetical protein
VTEAAAVQGRTGTAESLCCESRYEGGRVCEYQSTEVRVTVP